MNLHLTVWRLETRLSKFLHTPSYENSLKARYLKQSKWPHIDQKVQKIDFLLSVLRGSTCWELVTCMDLGSPWGPWSPSSSAISAIWCVTLILPFFQSLRVAHLMGSLLFEICTVVRGCLFFFFFWLCYAACRILVSWPRIKPTSPCGGSVES